MAMDLFNLEPKLILVICFITFIFIKAFYNLVFNIIFRPQIKKKDSFEENGVFIKLPSCDPI